jgi:catechol 2,3-dioxygenase
VTGVLPDSLRLGPVHLTVTDVDRSVAFYRDVIGFEVQHLMPSAAFVSAGGYHHHLGFNIWRGAHVPPAPPGTVGLREWTVVLPDRNVVDEVARRLDAAQIAHEDGLAADPWGNRVRFVSAP